MSQPEKTEKTEEKKWFDKLVDDSKWINDNSDHFKENGEILYDEDNLKRIKRFADAPMQYIDERIELNKGVSKNYHKFHHSILLAGITGFFAVLLSQSVIGFFETFHVRFLILIILLVIGSVIAMKIHLTYLILKWIGLLRVIRDSEIEVYYLSKTKEYRKSIECSTCHKRVPKGSVFCRHCGNELRLAERNSVP